MSPFILVIVSTFYCPMGDTTIDSEYHTDYTPKNYIRAVQMLERQQSKVGKQTRTFDGEECVLDKVKAGHRKK